MSAFLFLIARVASLTPRLPVFFLALTTVVFAQTTALNLDPVVVTTARSRQPLIVATDPKAAAQPAHAHDGADVLKNIPGFAVIRKGGADGDPMLRGMAGSRLGILVEGEGVLGGCSFRMDPPTAYIFPAAYDRITVIKGPQAVRYGPISPAGAVRFERDFARRDSTGATAFGTATIGEFGRRDGALDLRGGNDLVQGRLAATYASMDDYIDGAGNQVHGAYERWSTNASVAWTPDAQTFIELTGARSDGEAAYADRMMDGAVFDRENGGLRVRRTSISELIATAEMQVFVNAVDHVMDNYSLRAFVPSMMMPGQAVANPDRLTYGGRFALELTPAEAWRLDVGLDHQSNRHRTRSTMNQDAMPYQAKARVTDSNFHQTGVFLESSYSFSDDTRAFAGARADRWSATDKRATVSLGMMGGTVVNPTADLQRTSTLPGAFARVEHDLAQGSTVYLGLGHTQRFPDYWELISAESLTSASGFITDVEKTTQLDAGWLRQRGPIDLSVSTFVSRIDDYILIESDVAKPRATMGGMMMATRAATVARNIDAATVGGELGLGYRIGEHLRFDGSLAYVRGDNVTEDLPLAQLPPLEARLGFTYSRAIWSVGALWRGAAAQHRIAVNQGNIVGQDIGPSPAFEVVSINASWAPTTAVRLSAGIDNLFDTAYAEHISRAGAAVAGFAQTTRVNEPGRFIWFKCDYRH
ncbi:TonB-dependent copper receptor [Synoicihabitans lomoniglobus]|uniref:TonB-dependent copper receptor n=1 Tax=Synoicihabitans lomoniglobus TaxID=2909285 RepID=A0AAE9ZXK6_9BACT|nr:TonB-dependent copper receptor [Opitutaceae bacterium LMO-M01]WED64979.1 TonB-dependent copper receptor [Opitutaceae bacterium LMO-M01]